MIKKTLLRAMAGVVCSAALAAPSLAANNVTRLVVPFAAGGPIDVTARILAESVRDSHGTIIIDNKPGAGGNIGVDVIAKAAPDGRTIGIATLASHAVNPWLYSNIPFDAAKDFAPISLMVYVPNVLVVNADKAKELNLRSVQDLIDYAKKNPGKLNYASGGNGSGGHLAGELFKRQADVDVVHVPYNGGAPAQLALMAGQVDFSFDNLATAAPNIKAGKLVALAVTTAKRSKQLPDAPTMMESGLKDFEIATWWGLVAPAGTPQQEIDRLNAAFTQAMARPDVRQRFESLLVEPAPTTAKAFGDLMDKERTRYEAIVRDAGAKVD